jgi:hypothetical protein
MTTVQFAPHPAGYAVSFRYHPALVEAVKATVPPASRRWVPAQKRWLVDLGWADELAEVLTDAGHRVIGFELQRGYDNWAIGLFAAVGEDRAPAVHRALSAVLHPDKPTGDAELQQQLNDGRRAQVEQRDMELPPDPPNTLYAGGHCEEDFIPVAADDMITRLAEKANVPLAEVIRLAESRALDTLFDIDANGHGELIVWAPGEYPVAHRTAKPRVECRNLSGRRARQITESCYHTTVGHPHFMSLVDKRNWLFDHKYGPGEVDPEFTMTLADKQRMLERMRTPTARRRRSGRQALLEVDRVRLWWY